VTVSPGRFIWHEVMTTNPEGAIAFYQNVIGWSLMPWDADPGYRMFAWKHVPMAGVMLLPEAARQMGAPPHWLTYISVRDVDASLTQAMGMGARTYLEPMDVPTVGRMAVLADPQGATFAVFRPEHDGHVSDDVALGDFSWHELAADDSKAAWEFYRALFGWEYDSQFDMGPMGTYFMFRRTGGSRPLGGMYDRPPEVPVTHWLPYVNVANADTTALAVAQHGGRVLNGPMEVPGGDRVAQAMDPQGAVFAVHAVAPAPAPPPPPTPKPAPAQPAAVRPKRLAKRPVKKTPAQRSTKPKGRPVKKKPVKKQ
jgi:predicted enzyme related to lactoylglutathione lyase